jgi:hypothetical protein
MIIAIDSPVWQLVMVLGFIIALIIAARIIGNKAKKKKNRR